MKSKLFTAASALLNKIDNMTTDQFSIGAEREEREALRNALTTHEAQLDGIKTLLAAVLRGETIPPAILVNTIDEIGS